MRGSTSRLAALAVAALGALGTVLLFGAAGAQVPGASGSGAEIDKVGWWTQSNPGIDSPAGPITIPPPPDVPEGAIALGAFAGETDRVAAVGIVPDALPGATLISFTLKLTEAENSAIGLEAPAIVACPITTFWAPAVGGTWATAPTYDCALAKAEGARDDQGVWTFDLAPIGEVWLNPTGTVAADGVMIVPDPDAQAQSFRLAFDTVQPGSIQVALSATPPPDQGPIDTTPPAVTTPDTVGFEAPSTGGSTPDLGAGPQPAVTTLPPLTTAPVATPIATTRPGIPGATIPLFLAMLAVLLAASYWLGPAGEPLTHLRERGVSRALAERARLKITPPTETRR